MALRTPRRRISPRTKRRYRAIKDFLRRALGSTSQPDIKINSSIAVNVTNLKSQIVGIERQLNAVNKQLVYTDTTTNNQSTVYGSGLSVESDKSDGTETVQPKTSTERNSRGSEIKLLYKTLNDKISDASNLIDISESDHDNVKYTTFKNADRLSPNTSAKVKKSKRRISDESNIVDIHPFYEKHKSKSAYENFSSTYRTNSYHSLVNPTRDHHSRADCDGRNTKRRSSRHNRQRTHAQSEMPIPQMKSKDISGKRIVRNEDRHTSRRKDKNSRQNHELDPDFIHNIIRRQYSPVKMFGKRKSNHSQFSAPICRDQEYSKRENVVQESNLCSCCYVDEKSRFASYDMEDTKSICDTTLYNSKRDIRPKAYRQPNNHTDCLMYDMIPVKEKSNPKSQRKFIEDMMCYKNYKEVPPSPRTLRPQLNLKSQHFSNLDFAESDYHNNRKYSPKRHNTRRNCIDSYSNKSSTAMTDTIPNKIKANKHDNIQQDTPNIFPSPICHTRPVNVNQPPIINPPIYKSHDIESSSDKTDKALCEIKDILQSFLQEIKKGSISQVVKDMNTKNERNQSAETKQSTEEHSYHTDMNNCSIGPFPVPPPFIPPPYLNPCCYPVLPTYPLNCMHNSYVVPSPSYTCANCNKFEQPNCSNKENITKNDTNIVSETDKLIKEIYNLVTQSPSTSRKRENKRILTNRRDAEKRKAVVTRSVGESIRITRHNDAKVGTPKLKYYSKSCEAIGSALDEEHTARTTASYSDTILEKLSLDVTGASTTTETELTTEVATTEKKSSSSQSQEDRLTKMLRSFGLRKNKKKDVIEEEDEEESESNSSTEVEVKKKRKKPDFSQHLTAYSMHGQEYFHPPPISPHYPHDYFAHHPNLLHHYGPYPGYPGPLIHAITPPCPCTNEGHSNAHQREPEGPLCLKEIEVKSTATQSDRKLSFLGKFGKKKPIEIQTLLKNNALAQNGSTQTAQKKPGWWQQLNTPKPMTEPDPLIFPFKKRHDLSVDDPKWSKKMLKKLFHKRNPFSPRNLILRTLMGKDPSSFGDPPNLTRPKLFL